MRGRFGGILLAGFAVFALQLVVALSMPTITHADPPTLDPCTYPNLPTQDPDHPDVQYNNRCSDLTLEAVQDGLLDIRDITPSNTPQVNSQTTYTIKGPTIAGAARAQVDSMSADNLAKIPSTDWSDFTITDSTDPSDTIDANGVTVHWGGAGERYLTVVYDSGFDSPNEFDENNPQHLGVPASIAKQFRVVLEDTGEERPPAGTEIPGNEPGASGTCSVDAWNERDCIDKGGKWLANTGTDTVVWSVAGAALLILLIALLLRRRKKKEDKVVISAQLICIQ